LQALPQRAILDILNRKKHPLVKSSLLINLFDPDTEKRSNLLWTVKNHSDVFCQHVSAIIYVPPRFKNGFLKVEDCYVDTDSDNRLFWVLQLSNNINRPLYPKAEYFQKVKASFADRIKFDHKEENIEFSSTIKIKTFADSAPCVEQEFAIDSIVKFHAPY
jgi:hypothetical protein